MDNIVKIAGDLGIALPRAIPSSEAWQCWSDRVLEAEMHAWLRDFHRDRGDIAGSSRCGRQAQDAIAEANRYAVQG